MHGRVSVEEAMEGVALSPEQIQALTTAAQQAVDAAAVGEEVHVAYLAGDGETQSHQVQVALPHPDQQAVVAQEGQVIVQQQVEEQQVVIHQQGEQQQLVSKDGSVYLFDQATGEYQKCIYVEEGQQEQVQVEETQNHHVIHVPEGHQVDLQALLQAGAAATNSVLEDSAVAEAIAQAQEAGGGATVVVQQEEQASEVLTEEQVQLVRDSDGNLLQVVVRDGDSAEGDSNKLQENPPAVDQLVLAHRDDWAEDSSKECTVCGKSIFKRDYLSHFKSEHADVRLGCPKCPQTYHSPELLNVHYKHFHLKDDEAEAAAALAGAAVLELAELAEEEQRKPPPSKQPKRSKQASSSSSTSSRKARRGGSLKCEVCLKSFESQRDFTNHRRRKGFCRPPAQAPVPQTRRIGIIRKSL